jgi:hypothetical protein
MTNEFRGKILRREIYLTKKNCKLTTFPGKGMYRLPSLRIYRVGEKILAIACRSAAVNTLALSSSSAVQNTIIAQV